MKGETKTGFVYDVDDSVFDTMEFLEALCELDEGDIAGLVHAVNAVLGPKEKRRLYKHLKSIGVGSTPDNVYAELESIIDAFKVKN